MKSHLQFSQGTIQAWSQESFDNLPVEKLTDCKYYKPELYQDTYRYSENDYNYSKAHKEAFDKYFRKIDSMKSATKDAVVRFRCSEQLKSQIEAKSRAEGKGMSEYLTDLVKRDLYQQ